ncbi:MAG: DUF445 family protein [Bacillaceae bacterium]
MKYKKIANRTLIYLSMAFIIVLGVKVAFFQENILIELLLFTLEAALVGGIADWFAVTALFEHPLGIKIPHTALLPKNREKVISAIVHLVEKELLEKSVLIERVHAFPLMKQAIPLIEQHKGKIKQKLMVIVLKEIHFFSTDEGAEKLEKIIKQKLIDFSFAPVLISLSKTVMNNEQTNIYFEKLVDELVKEIKKSSARNQIYTYLVKKKEEQTEKTGTIGGFFKRAIFALAEQTNALNLDDAADIIFAEVIHAIEELKEVNHPLRKEIKVKIEAAIVELQSNENWQYKVESWKNNLIQEMNMKEIIKEVASSTHEQAPIMVWLDEQIEIQWQGFKDNTKLQDKFEIYIKGLIIKLISKEHKRIGYIVEEVLSGFTNENLIAFIEEKVGEDLQWIRVNGSIVGGIIGIVIFSFLHFIYDPILNVFM